MSILPLQEKRNILITLVNSVRLFLVLCVLILIQFISDINSNNLIPLQIIGIITSIYAILLLVFPFDKIKLKPLGFIILLLDVVMVFALLSFTGEISSPFFILIFFPIISAATIYETAGSLFVIIVLLIYFLFYLFTKNYQPKEYIDLIIKMVLTSFLSLYLGNVGKIIKGKKIIKKLKNKLEEIEKNKNLIQD